MDLAEIITLIVAFYVGAILGSFACCQAWRIRLKQLERLKRRPAKRPGQSPRPAQIKKPQSQPDPEKWSVCLSCGTHLKPWENIPIFSWLIQRGKCNHCGARIGRAEIFSEVTLGLTMSGLVFFFYLELKSQLLLGPSTYLFVLIAVLLVLIISLCVMWILLIYDAKWQELPTKLLTILNACATIYTIPRFVGVISSSASAADIINPILSTIAAVVILAGLYFCLYYFSKERLVGSGDWLLALPIAIMLGNWWLALVTPFLSNLLGSIVGIILKIKRGARQIPFGPFLILAFVIVYIMQPWLLKLLVGL